MSLKANVHLCYYSFIVTHEAAIIKKISEKNTKSIKHNIQLYTVRSTLCVRWTYFNIWLAIAGLCYQQTYYALVH